MPARRPTVATTQTHEPTRTGLSVDALKRVFLDNLFYIQARFPSVATPHDHYMALAYTVHDRLLHHWLRSAETYLEKRSRTTVYLSAEFLIGPQLRMSLLNLDLEDEVRDAMRALGMDLDRIAEEEDEPGLGTGLFRWQASPIQAVMDGF